MIRKNKNQHRPLYREIVRDAFATTWRERKLWIFALFAGILQTGGVYDVILVSIKRMPDQVQSLFDGQGMSALLAIERRFSGMDAIQSTLGFLSFLQGLILAIMIILAFWGLSAVAQGAITYALGTRSRGKGPTFRESLTVGARHLWPILTLNVFTLGLIWLARFIVLIPFAFSIKNPSLLSVFGYFLSFMLFLLISVALTAIHLLALNAIILDKAHLWPAICQAYEMAKRSWALVLEIGAIMFAVGALALAAGAILFFVTAIPLFLFMVATALLQFWTLLWIATVIGFILFFTIMVSAGAWAIAFQYAVWQQLYLRIGSGTASAKIIRWVRWLVGHAA